MGPFAESAYLFKHALLRDAAYQLHLPTERASLHALSLLALEAHPEAAHFFAELADHALAAQAAPQTVLPSSELQTRELAFLQRAAAAALAAFRNEDAALALARIREHPLADEPTRVEAGCEEASVHLNCGRVRQSAELLRGMMAAGIRDRSLQTRVLLRLVGSSQLQGELEGALSLLEQARRAAEGGSDDLLVQVKVAEAGVLGLGGNLPEAERLCREALEATRRAGRWPAFERCALDLARLLRERNSFDEAWQLLDEVEQVPDAALRDRERPGWANARGNICWRQGKTDEAELWYRKALELHRARGNRLDEGVVVLNLGNIWNDRHQPERALKHYLMGAEILRETGYLPGYALAMGLCGNACLALHRDMEGLAYFRTSAELYSRTGALSDQSMQEANVGVALSATGDEVGAEAQFVKAEQLAARAGASRWIASHRSRRAGSALAQGRFEEAAGLFDSAIAATRSLGEKPNMRILSSLTQAASAHLHLGHHDRARDLCREATEVAVALGACDGHPNRSMADRYKELQELKARLGVT